ncbi:excalibur calcium-binding domain-containing protein [Ideonella dechloratans]|uniref:excalibur calcium-binding domain-containing protein n=1 Tax=Ideonella dechloratans TaxID=36863 RepID=UPI0014786F8C|nr:excalibur calcium-binding domain-containing protein [Ideonella dechloratans]UFU11833.1 excalibur calcium-binding domain-containing protein [Ideonella dechloratans]
MIRCTTRILATAACAAAVFSAHAAPLNKCVVNGSVTYQQAACAPNQPRKDPTLEELNAAQKLRRAEAASAAAAQPPKARALPNGTLPAPAAGSRFRCDGRQYCSQMTSCEEAKYFLAHCPDVKMDGNGDGVPCEKQWCGPH